MKHFILIFGLTISASAPAVAIVACSGVPALTGADAGSVARETARGAVQVSADALLKLDTACADTVAATRDKALGQRCAAFYGTARTAIVSAAIAVDTWDDVASRSAVTCAVLATAAGLSALGKELRAKGVDARALEAIDDAVALSKLIGACPAQKDGG